MPYLPQADRERIQLHGARTPRALNYAITVQLIATAKQHAVPLACSKLQQELSKIIMAYWKATEPAAGWQESVFYYASVNDILGALAGALMEFDRRNIKHFGAEEAERRAIARTLSKVVHDFYATFAVPHETKQIAENGDLYL